MGSRKSDDIILEENGVKEWLCFKNEKRVRYVFTGRERSSKEGKATYTGEEK